MKKLRNKLKCNKGFSLVELLVALAVSSVVMTIIIAFITQGTKFYNKQGNSVRLQNELQEISNVVDEAIQEATYLEISSNANAVKVFTGEYVIASGTEVFNSSKGSSRLVYWNQNKIYVFDTAKIPATDVMEGYRYGSNLEVFNVSVNSNSISGDSLIQPLQLDVILKVSNNGASRSEKKTITVRNTLEKVIIGGVEYTIGAKGTRLNKKQVVAAEEETTTAVS